MELSVAFRERLELMELARNDRLRLLQAEKELQANKCRILTAKLANIRVTESRCLSLHQRIASLNFKISVMKSGLDEIDNKYHSVSEKSRVLKSEVMEMEELEKKNERVYELKNAEMKAFRENVQKFVAEYRAQITKLRNQVNDLKSTFLNLQGNNGILSNSEIAEAEMRKTQLIAMKENLEKSLASNRQIKSQLQMQLENVWRSC